MTYWADDRALDYQQRALDAQQERARKAMTMTAEDMPSLPNRLEAAAGGTRDLDAEIELLMPQWEGVTSIKIAVNNIPGSIVREYTSPSTGRVSHGTAGANLWTTKTDEAYRIVNTLFPDHVRTVLQSNGDSWLFSLTLDADERDGDVFIGHGATKALAICAAVFWAKENGR